MEVQPMDKEDAAREKGIYHVTVVGSGVNFLLLLFNLKSATPFPKCYLQEKWTFDS